MAVTIRPIAEFLEDQEVLAQVPKEMIPFAEKPHPWTGFIGFEGDQVIGVCGFKGEPKDQAVEIAYFTFPGNEGRGCATGMAHGLVALAKESGKVNQVIAHTLKEENASTSILKKLSFEFNEEVMDPEDGSVWRWSLNL